jgi:excisionase family DNA binding protein
MTLDGCRRRDSNPRHADYDAKAILRPDGVCLGLAEAERQIGWFCFGLFLPGGVALVASLLPGPDLEISRRISGIGNLLPYNPKVKALMETSTVGVITDVNDLAELLVTKLAPIFSGPSADDEREGYWTVAEASTYMSCDRQRIYDLNSQRRLRCVKDGKRLLTRRVWIDEYLEGCC